MAMIIPGKFPDPKIILSGRKNRHKYIISRTAFSSDARFSTVAQQLAKSLLRNTLERGVSMNERANIFEESEILKESFKNSLVFRGLENKEDFFASDRNDLNCDGVIVILSMIPYSQI